MLGSVPQRRAFDIPPVRRMLLIILVALTVLYAGLRTRVLPVVVQRAWFALVMLNVVVATNLLTLVAHSLQHVGASPETTKLLCTYVCAVTFRIALWFNPHIQIRIDERRQKWVDVPCGSAMALNHTSFWDAFVFVGSAPLSYIYNTKTLMKASLRKLPIFGAVFDRVGHFPVYFKSSVDGDFSVDKERQAVVAEDVNKHLAAGGRIALFPEGAINKTPVKLHPFRHGSFATIVQHKLKMYYFLTVGNDETWPASASIGGFPADVDVVIGALDVDHTRETAKEIAERLQTEMQEVLDRVRAERATRRQR